MMTSFGDIWNPKKMTEYFFPTEKTEKREKNKHMPNKLTQISFLNCMKNIKAEPLTSKHKSYVPQRIIKSPTCIEFTLTLTKLHNEIIPTGPLLWYDNVTPDKSGYRFFKKYNNKFLYRIKPWYKYCDFEGKYFTPELYHKKTQLAIFYSSLNITQYPRILTYENFKIYLDRSSDVDTDEPSTLILFITQL